MRDGRCYRIEYKKTVAKELRRLPGMERERIVAKILSLADDPLGAGAVKLRGETALYRVRSGDYRIIYRVEEGRLVILVVKIGHRKDVYRKFGL